MKNCIKIVLFKNVKKPLFCLTYRISSNIIVMIVSNEIKEVYFHEDDISAEEKTEK